MTQEEYILISQLKCGDGKAWRLLYERHYRVLCRMANDFLGGDSFLAETIVEDVIFHLWEIREKVEISSSLRGYLMCAVRHQCLNYLQSGKEKHETRFSELPLESLDQHLFFKKEDQHPLGLLLERELDEKIKQAIDSIPADARKVFRMSRFQGKKNEEIAVELGISVNTVKYHIKKALASMRTQLKDYLLFILFLLKYSIF